MTICSHCIRPAMPDLPIGWASRSGTASWSSNPAGDGVVARLRAARRERLAAVLCGWSDQDRDALGTLLARLNVDLDAHRAG